MALDHLALAAATTFAVTCSPDSFPQPPDLAPVCIAPTGCAAQMDEVCPPSQPCHSDLNYARLTSAPAGWVRTEKVCGRDAVLTYQPLSGGFILYERFYRNALLVGAAVYHDYVLGCGKPRSMAGESVACCPVPDGG